MADNKGGGLALDPENEYYHHTNAPADKDGAQPPSPLLRNKMNVNSPRRPSRIGKEIEEGDLDIGQGAFNFQPKDEEDSDDFDVDNSDDSYDGN